MQLVLCLLLSSSPLPNVLYAHPWLVAYRFRDMLLRCSPYSVCCGSFSFPFKTLSVQSSSLLPRVRLITQVRLLVVNTWDLITPSYVIPSTSIEPWLLDDLLVADVRNRVDFFVKKAVLYSLGFPASRRRSYDKFSSDLSILKFS